MSALTLAVADAANNCTRHNARALVVLKSGREFEGVLERPQDSLYAEGATIHMKIEPGGWMTILFSEVAACGAVKRQ